jgi:hypothetical protein
LNIQFLDAAGAGDASGDSKFTLKIMKVVKDLGKIAVFLIVRNSSNCRFDALVT